MSYGIYLAKIVSYPSFEGGENDDRLIVQITPQMDNISENLPCWPFFFRDEQFRGSPGDLVWVICDDEFSVGYILGQANYFAYPEDHSTFSQYSISNDLKESISDIMVNLKMEQLNFYNIKVTYWNDSCIHFIERKTGGSIIAYNTGSIFIMRPNEFIVKVGNTSLMINGSGVSASGSSLKLQSEDVQLGNNPVGYLVTTGGVSGDAAMTSKFVRA